MVLPGKKKERKKEKKNNLKSQQLLGKRNSCWKPFNGYFFKIHNNVQASTK